MRSAYVLIMRCKHSILLRESFCISSLSESSESSCKRFHQCESVLSYSSVKIVNHFVLEAIVAVSLRTQAKTIAELRSRVQFLSMMLQKEFIFPLGGLEPNLIQLSLFSWSVFSLSFVAGAETELYIVGWKHHQDVPG